MASSPDALQATQTADMESSPNPSRESSADSPDAPAISMLSAIAQVQASQHSDGTDTMVEPHRQVTFQSSPAKLDLLFLVLAFIPIKELFRARRMCKSWKQRIDITKNNSREWKEIFLAHFPHMTFCQPCQRYNGTDDDIDWKGYIEISAPRHLRNLSQDSGMAGDNVTADSLNKVLDSLQRAAVCAAAMLRVPFQRFIDLDTFNAGYTVIYYATLGRSPDNHSDLVYGWWQTSVKVICNEIQELLVQEPESARCAAADSFDSYVKVMAGVLKPLDRGYVTRFNLATIKEVAAPEQAALRTGLQLDAPAPVT